MLNDSSRPARLQTRPASFTGTRRSRIAAKLRYRILYGELSSGDVLSIDELAEQFGVSRTPVREALLTLPDDGLVEMVAKRRVRIIGLPRPACSTGTRYSGHSAAQPRDGPPSGLGRSFPPGCVLSRTPGTAPKRTRSGFRRPGNSTPRSIVPADPPS